MKIILVRHGETEANTKDVWVGHTNSDLTEDGRKQVEKVGFRLKNQKFDAAYCSDLTRARDTAQGILKHHEGITLTETELLRERYLGDWEGIYGPDADMNKRPTNYEYNEQMLKRADKILKQIYVAHPDDTVLVAAHGGFNRALISTAMKLDHYSRSICQDNTCVNIIKYEPKQHEPGKISRIKLLNCTKHLDEC